MRTETRRKKSTALSGVFIRERTPLDDASEMTHAN